MTQLPVDEPNGVGSVHPTTMLDAPPNLHAPVAAALSPLAADATTNTGVLKTAHKAGAARAALSGDDQTRSPTVIEASLDRHGVTTIAGSASLSSMPPAPPLLPPPNNMTGKIDEVRSQPPPAATAATATRCELEGFTPFSTCHLWKLMMSFYDREGVESWAQGIVPHFITSNTFIAKRYSNVLRAYFLDAMQPNSPHRIDPTQPFYIVELGTGSGKFSFYFLKALADAAATLAFPLDQIRYIMTDFTAQNFAFWQSHAALAPFVQRGIVDFAIFDATTDTCLTLHHAKTTITPHSLINPVCVIANYLFDTLHHDLFHVDAGVLQHGLISVGSTRATEPDPLDPAIIKRLSNLYTYERIDESFYGAEKGHYNAILQWYHDYFDPLSSGATILVPIGALAALDRLTALTTNGIVVLSGDKGNSNPEHFRGVTDPHIAIHGSFSVMVNYHAIGIYCASQGGFALHSAQEEASLKVSVFVLPPSVNDQETTELYGDALAAVCDTRATAFPHLSLAFDDEIASFGPNDFFILQKTMKEESKTPSLKAVLALLKLSHWDPDVFYKFRDVLLDHAPSSQPKLKRDVLEGIPRVWRNYYALDKEKDVAFEIGRLYYGFHDYDRALVFYRISTQEMGKHHVTSHNMGLCHYSKRQLAIAATCFAEAFALNSSYQKAATWLQRVQRELGATEVAKEATMELRDVQQIELVMPSYEEETSRLSKRVGGNEDVSPRRRPDAASLLSECTTRSSNCLQMEDREDVADAPAIGSPLIETLTLSPSTTDESVAL